MVTKVKGITSVLIYCDHAQILPVFPVRGAEHDEHSQTTLLRAPGDL